MGSGSSSFEIIYGENVGHWENLPGFLSFWKDRSDPDIETRCVLNADGSVYPLFKLQYHILQRGYRIVLRDYYPAERQITVIEKCSSEPDARLAYQSLVVSVLQDKDMVSPESVETALRRHNTPVQGRFQHVGNPANNRFPEPMLQPFRSSWNPVNFEADIIFIHGLDGHAESTWTNDLGLWPIIWLLDSDHGIESVRNQFKIGQLPRRNKIRMLSVSHHAGSFADDDESDPVIIARHLVRLLFHAGVGSKPVIWLTHSLGGLIVKEVLHFASEHETRRDIFTSTKGVVFFGTPHNGASWATTQRQVTRMRNSKALFYLDCAPSVGTNAGNLARLNSLNEFFLNSNIPFLNFSEGTITPRLFDWLVQPIIVSDAQARMNGPDTFIIEAKELAAQIALGKIPARVHYYYPTSHHLNIAKPSDRLEPTYYYTRIYVANWIQLRPPANNLHEIFNWDQFAYRIFSTVRVYADVIESIVKNDPAATMITSTAREQVSGALIPLSASVTTVLRSMSINELLIALFSDALVAADVPGIRVVVAVVGRIGALFGVAVSLVTAEGLAARLNSYVRNLLRNNTDTLRQVVNLVSRYVMPDFRAALASDASQQELEATLNYLCRNVAQTICSVFLQPTSPHTTFESPDLIRGATIAHHDLLFQAEIVVNQLPSLLQGTTEIRTDGDEDRVRTILTPQFIRDVLRRDVNPAPV